MKRMAVGTCEALTGVLDGVKYKIMCLKEPDYNMKLMSTYGAVINNVNYRPNHRTYKDESGMTKSTTFYYTQVFANHFLFCHAVDDHNNLHHSVPSIKGTWKTHNWVVRVFSFLLAISEVKAYLAH